MPKIFLIGFMGSGKTTIGKQLALLLKYEFIDLDNIVETREGTTISELFASKGENYFREKESLHLKSLTQLTNAVIATGGGTPCFFDTMSWMNKNGTTVYLEVAPEILHQRLMKEKDHRPLLSRKTDEGALGFIKEKLSERDKFYLQSRIIIDAAVLNGEELLKKLEKEKII